MSSKRNQGKSIKSNYKGSSSEEEEEQYEVEKILDVKYNPKTKQKEYLVKWENWSVQDSTWEPYENLQNVKDLVKEFEKKLEKKKEPTANSMKETREAANKHREFAASASSGKKLEMEIPSSKEEIKKQQPPRKQQSSYRKKSVSSDSSFQNEEIIDQVMINKNDFQEANPQSQQTEENEFVFEEIIDKRTSNENIEYLIRFSNVDAPQWVDVNQLITVKDDILAFEEKLKNQKQSKKSIARIDVQISEVEDQQKDNKKKQLTSQSKRPTARRSQPFVAHIEEEEEEEVNKKKTTSQNLINTQEKESHAPKQLSQKIGPAHIGMPSSSSTVSLETDTKINSKLKPTDSADIQIGDFKTDNVDKIELLGNPNDLLTSRFEVFWKSRQDNVNPGSQIYSASFLRRYEPQILIDYLLKHTAQLQNNR